MSKDLSAREHIMQTLLREENVQLCAEVVAFCRAVDAGNSEQTARIMAKEHSRYEVDNVRMYFSRRESSVKEDVLG